MMKHYVNVVNSKTTVNSFQKNFTIDVWRDPKYSAACFKSKTIDLQSLTKFKIESFAYVEKPKMGVTIPSSYP